MGKDKNIASCYQCAGIKTCYGSKSPGILREEARAAASGCGLLFRGSPRETVRVSGYRRGLSRKNAQKLVEKGAACWICHKTICALSELPVSIKKRLEEGEIKERELLFIS